jgi:primosomal protein N'
VSLDSLLSLAHWNIYERIAATLTRLRETASEEFILQTRHPEEDILKTVLSGNFSGFYRNELRTRNEMGYPPYTVLIKLSVTGKEDEVIRRMQEAATALHPYELVTYTRLLRAPAGKVLLHGFLRVPRASWPDKELLARLRALPALYTISINPDSIL